MNDHELYDLKMSMLSLGENPHSVRVLKLIRMIENLKLSVLIAEDRARMYQLFYQNLLEQTDRAIE